MMILAYIIDIDKMLKLTKGQGHKVKGQGHIYVFMWNSCFDYKSWTDVLILMILTYVIDIYETAKLTQGQGHTVKGQGHICIYSKILFWLKIMNGW